MRPHAKALARLLGIEIPLIQAPTGSIATPELAAAVSNAGGLGSLGLTWMAEEDAIAAVRRLRSLTTRPFMVNFVLAFPPKALPAILAARVPIVSLSWGLDATAIREIRKSGAICLVQAGSARGAEAALEAGAHAVILQGVAAGGHVRSTSPLRMLLSEVAASLPNALLIAAGGIATGADIRMALSRGAGGAMLGTRFVATQESAAHPDYKMRLLRAKAADTSLTICFSGGWSQAPHRVLRNQTIEEWEAAGFPPEGIRPGEGDVVARTVNGLPIFRYEDTAPRIGMTGAVDQMAQAWDAFDPCDRPQIWFATCGSRRTEKKTLTESIMPPRARASVLQSCPAQPLLPRSS